MVQAGQKREKLTEQISALLNADLISESANLNLLADVFSVLQDQNRNKIIAMKLVLYYLVHRNNEWAVHPDYAKYEQKQFFEKLDKLFEETRIKP